MNDTFDMPHFVTVPISENHKKKVLALFVASKLFHPAKKKNSWGGVPQSGLFAQVMEVRLSDRINIVLA